jgi:hypothetical protein
VVRAGVSAVGDYRPAYRVIVDSRDVTLPGESLSVRLYRWRIVGPRHDWSQWADTLDQCHATLHAAMRGMLRLDRMAKA